MPHPAIAIRPPTVTPDTPLPESVGRFLRSGCGFDALYDAVIVRPFVRVANLIKNEPVDGIYAAVVGLNKMANELLSKTQNGQLRWYAANMGGGLLLMFVLVLVVL